MIVLQIDRKAKWPRRSTFDQADFAADFRRRAGRCNLKGVPRSLPTFCSGPSMRAHQRISLCVSIFGALAACGTLGIQSFPVKAADWRQFRGPGGLGTSGERGLPAEWSSHKNVVWSTQLPGPGTSSPVIVGNRIYLTCYTGYAVDANAPGNMSDLKRHLLSVDRKSGKILWTKHFDPLLPEHKYVGEGSYHGYSSSTPISDGERLYVFFGKSGVYLFRPGWKRDLAQKRRHGNPPLGLCDVARALQEPAHCECQRREPVDRRSRQDDGAGSLAHPTFTAPGTHPS